MRTHEVTILALVIAVCSVVVPSSQNKPIAPQVLSESRAPRQIATPQSASSPSVVTSHHSLSGGPYYLGGVSLGNTETEVAAALGPPVKESETLWIYGESSYHLLSVAFRQGRVVEVRAGGDWVMEYDFPNPAAVVPLLPLRESVSACGSTPGEILSAHGEPDEAYPQSWLYHKGRTDLTFTFQHGIVLGTSLRYANP